jgi:hypothetical protein
MPRPLGVFVFVVHEMNLVAILNSSHQLPSKRPLHQGIEQVIQLPSNFPLPAATLPLLRVSLPTT